MRYLADENFNGDILRGVCRQRPDLDVVRVQDVGLSGSSDPEILEWAAREGRVVITHDGAVVQAATAALLAENPTGGTAQ